MTDWMTLVPAVLLGLVIGFFIGLATGEWEGERCRIQDRMKSGMRS